MHANKKEELKVVGCGNIAAAVGLRITTTGDTLCDPAVPAALEVIDAPPPAMSVVIEPKTQAGQSELAAALDKLAAEDPSFNVGVDEETGQTVISGMGELHLEIIVDRLAREFKIAANVGRPQVAYRETLTAPVEHEEIFQNEVAGRGQFAQVRLRLEPTAPGAGVLFENALAAGTLTKEFIAAIERGVRAALGRGPLANYPVIDVQAVLLSAVAHAVDSNETAFQIAASQAVTAALRAGSCALVEPIMSLDLLAPESSIGAVVGNIAARRGRVLSLQTRGDAQAVTAEVPLATMFGYSTDVRSLTQGRATFTMRFLRYSPVPAQVSESIVNRVRGA